MRILVTGAGGFLGSHLVEQLLAQGHEVLAVDNFYTGTRGNIGEFFDHPNFEFLRHDVTFPLFVEVDAIYNLASPASPVHYQRDPVQTIKTNVLGAINLLGLAKRLRVPILQASTSEVYGDPLVSPQTESYWGNVNPLGPRACYDEGKRAAETLFYDYHRQHGVRTRIARIFNTYGPRMAKNDGRVVSNFVNQSLAGEDLTIYGDGSQTRSFCYVDDLVGGLIALMAMGDDIEGAVNLGSSREVSVLALANMIIEKVGSKSQIALKNLPIDDPKQRRPNTTKAKQSLGWEATVDLDSGLDRTIEYFQLLSPGEVTNE